MKPLELALKYMDIVFDRKNPDELGHLFADEFTFSGPFYEFHTAEDYIKSLKTDPPVGFQCKILRTFEGKSSACLVYQFSKPGVSLPMAQLFETNSGKISRIMLIFDTAAFS